MTHFPSPEELFEKLAMEVQYYLYYVGCVGDADRTETLEMLRRHVKAFRDFELRHPDYRPPVPDYEIDDPGERRRDVCAALHLLKMACGNYQGGAAHLGRATLVMTPLFIVSYELSS
jgi:hypothetical protein